MKWRRLLAGAGVSLLALLLSYFLFRNTLLQWSFRKVQARAYNSYGLRVNAGDLHFAGLSRIQFKHLIVQPDNADTLLYIKELECNVSLSDVLTARIGFDEIRVLGGKLSVYNLPDKNNLPATKTERQKTDVVSAATYRERASGLKNQLLRALKTSFFLQNFHIYYVDSSFTENIFFPRAEYDFHNFSGLMINLRSGDSILMTGKVLSKNTSYQISMQHVGNKDAYLPFLDREHSLQCRFQSVSTTITLEDSRSELKINTACEAKDFELKHWRIANDNVVFPKAQFHGVWRIRDHSLELDSSSTFTLEQVPVQIFSNYSAGEDTTFSLNLYMPETVSDSFFRALPKGMFGTVKGISCTGTLAYQMQFFLNTKLPDSLTFFSSLSRKDFRLNHFGAENYARVNAPFVYEAYDKERLMRKIIIGSDNPMFTPLDRVSAYLTKAVLQSEDPSFMQHNGFLPEAFRESIIKNYKERRFARGGSTISMQLVKNVFLSRDKTISRKAEEALIVYLIENLNLVSKERMLEIYLNVIEWGPNVYGIGEASRFYFNKNPSELTLEESIFLASIIPAPKYFRYRFDKQGNLKNDLGGYFRILTNRMAGKGWLTTADTTGLLPEVQLKGPARNLILPADSIKEEEAEEEFF